MRYLRKIHRRHPRLTDFTYCGQGITEDTFLRGLYFFVLNVKRDRKVILCGNCVKRMRNNPDFMTMKESMK